MAIQDIGVMDSDEGPAVSPTYLHFLNWRKICDICAQRINDGLLWLGDRMALVKDGRLLLHYGDLRLCPDHL